MTEGVSVTTRPAEKGGYERVTITGRCDFCGRYMNAESSVHRMLAIALAGLDAVDGKHVHHENGIPWDNRPANLTLMDPGDHTRHHQPWTQTE